MSNKKITGIIAIIIVSIISLIGTSVSFLMSTVKGDKTVSIQTGVLKIDYDEGNEIDLEEAFPMSDMRGQRTTPYTFTVRNTGDLKAYYTISFEEDENNTLDNNEVKYRLQGDNGYDSGVQIVGEQGSGTFPITEERSLKVGEEVNYTLHIWLREEAENHYEGLIYKNKLANINQ